MNSQAKKIMDSEEYKAMKDLQEYECKCLICGRETTTRKNTANEMICYECRS